MKNIKYLLIISIILLLFYGCTDNKDPVITEDPIVDDTPPTLPTYGEPEKLLILQAYGTGTATDGSISHSFIELYNPQEEPVKLDGLSIYYADGTKVIDSSDIDESWKRISLDDKIIEAQSSFLILGARRNFSGRLQIPNNSGDINVSDLILSNRAFKIVLMEYTGVFDVQNPFNIDGEGTKMPGYIDMVGTVNDDTDQILGYENTPARISKQVSARRLSLTDTDNNSTDFASIDYRVSGISNTDLEKYSPKNGAYGEWDPSVEISITIEPPGLMILQAYGTGVLESDTTGAVSHSFIELYNNTNEDIDISTYSLQYAEGTRAGKTTVDAWTKIDLTGNIPAKCSYLIIGQLKNASGRYQINESDADLLESAFALSNRSFKVVLLSNQNLLEIANPFDIDGIGTKAAGYIDMLGVNNQDGYDTDTIDAYEGSNYASLISRQASARRKNLTDTNNNITDFTRIDYRTTGISDTQLLIYSPKGTSYGAWNPITGEKE